MKNWLFLILFISIHASAATVGEVRRIQIGSYQLNLYPNSPRLESDEISVSIRDHGPDECNGGAADAYYTIDQQGECTELSYHDYDGRLIEKTSYCASDVLNAGGHTYKIKQVLDRCERFAKSSEVTQSDGEKVTISGAGGILHRDLYRYPLIRLVDETGRIWVTDSDQIDYFVELSRTQTVSETGACQSKIEFLGFAGAKACAVENAKKQAEQACNDLGATAVLDTLKEDKAPWMCYTEAFNEQFCATYSVRCSR